MIHRRSLLSALAAIPVVGKTFAAPAPASRGCFVPEKFKEFRWHIIKSRYSRDGFEVAEWVNDPRNGPENGGHWIRWGYCGDFPSLCHAEYIGPVDLISQRLISIVPLK